MRKASMYATDLRGLRLILDNASAHKCKLVQDFLETETVVQLSNPPYSPDLSPCDFPVCFTEKSISTDVDMGSKVLLLVPLFSVYRVCPKKFTYLHSEPRFED